MTEEWKGKGLWERRSSISSEVKALRYELAFSKDEERKKEIKKRLVELGDIKGDN